MKLIFALYLICFSTLSSAEVTAADVRAAGNARNQACTSGSSRDCSAAVNREQSVNNQLNQEIGASLNRGEYGDQRRVRIQEEERWREEARRR